MFKSKIKESPKKYVYNKEISPILGFRVGLDYIYFYNTIKEDNDKNSIIFFFILNFSLKINGFLFIFSK